LLGNLEASAELMHLAKVVGSCKKQGVEVSCKMQDEEFM